MFSTFSVQARGLKPCFALFAGSLLLMSLASLTGAEAAKLKTLHSFCAKLNCTDGDVPMGGVVMDASGNVYGTTVEGGKNNSGLIFELSRDPISGKWKEKDLYNFCTGYCTDGSWPTGDLIIDVNGNLYGTVSDYGGVNFGGVAFELIPNADHSRWKYKVLYTFCSKDDNCTDGNTSRAGLTYQGAAAGLPYDGDSPLYGTTWGGGAHGHGTVFELTPRPGKTKWSEKFSTASAQ